MVKLLNTNLETLEYSRIGFYMQPPITYIVGQHAPKTAYLKRFQPPIS